MLDPTEKEQVMKRAALVVGIAGVLAVAPQAATAGNVTQVVKPQLVKSQIVKSQLVRSQVVRSQVVRSQLVRSQLVRSQLVESAVVRSAVLDRHTASVAGRVKARFRR